MKIGIFGRLNDKKITEYLEFILKEFRSRYVEVLVDRTFEKSPLFTHSDLGKLQRLREENFASLDLLVSLGGDGTILRAIAHIKNLGVPIIGINVGRLGFLSTIQKEDIHILMNNIFEKDLKIVERSVLELLSPKIDEPFALNEISINRKDTASMVTVEAYLNREYLATYWADGLLISTPTGSTAYALSCGGPIIEPNSNVLAVVPIAAHNLNARPLIISDTTEIRLRIKGREKIHLASLDSRVFPVEDNTEIVIKKATFTIKLVELKSEGFIKTLRKKLLWGEDKRN